jgi:hypothetical protein
LAILPLEGGGMVIAVHRVSSTWPRPPRLRASPKYFRDRSAADLPEANRVVAWGQEPDGSISFIETKAEWHGAA